MKNKKTIILWALCAYFFLFNYPVFAQEIKEMEPFDKNDRILIVAPHPDDEAIGCSGLIQHALKAGAQLKVVYLTNGDHNELAFIVYEKRLVFRKSQFLYMGSLRRQESINAMKSLGVQEDNLIFLGYPDFGTFTIFNKFWQTKKAFKNMFTRVNKVPYKKDLSYGAPYVGESILSDFKKVLLNYKPTKIFVSHPADVNVDHKSAYLFLQVALLDLGKEAADFKVYPYLIHCVGWPKPRHYHPELDLEPPNKFKDSQINWLKISLAPEELDKKHRMILFYRSQTASSAFYLLAFARKNELFGDYPDIELKEQVSLEARAPDFFGFTRLFKNEEEEGMFSPEVYIEDQGQVSYAVVDKCLLMRIEPGLKSARRSDFLLYMFGYSGKTSFPAMPKLRIVVRKDKVKVYDGSKRVNDLLGLSVDVGEKATIIRIPLSLLGHPTVIFTALKSYKDSLSPDATGFRRIVLK
jgi:LmbE family N-acetylglucosaminyl deacetylase